MMIRIRPATISDLEAIVPLMLSDAQARASADAILWKLAVDPYEKIRTSLESAMKDKTPAFRRNWIIAKAQGSVVGVTHAILLPVPPIYAGAYGPPGLIMEDCALATDAPVETATMLLDAAEKDLIDAGARILLGSSVSGGPWEDLYKNRGYVALTHYFAKTSLGKVDVPQGVQPASAGDVAAIVKSSAIHRKILNDLNPVFWKPHEAADARFFAWMERSLTLTDRNMFVSDPDHAHAGYAISQPATPLHVPVPHDVTGLGIVDDFYHNAISDVNRTGEGYAVAAALLKAAEAARARRGDRAVLVVCPADWASKSRLLTDAGYHVAITWYFKLVA